MCTCRALNNVLVDKNPLEHKHSNLIMIIYFENFNYCMWSNLIKKHTMASDKNLPLKNYYITLAGNRSFIKFMHKACIKHA
jgi:hypothetical protein